MIVVIIIIFIIMSVLSWLFMLSTSIRNLNTHVQNFCILHTSSRSDTCCLIYVLNCNQCPVHYFWSLLLLPKSAMHPICSCVFVKIIYYRNFWLLRVCWEQNDTLVIRYIRFKKLKVNLFWVFNICLLYWKTCKILALLVCECWCGRICGLGILFTRLEGNGNLDADVILK